MYTDALYALLHYFAIFAVVVTLGLELALCRGALDTSTVQRLARIDIAFFVAAMLALATGVLRAVFGIKGWAFYAGNLFFWLKIGTFFVIGLLSIVPTMAFIRWRKAGCVAAANESARVRRFLVIETMLLPVLPLCAVLMARGVGIFD
jgi:putative membrane protein